jgi:hypothetical protein
MGKRQTDALGTTSSKRKLRVLVAEAGDHYKILEHIYHLLHDNCELTFLIIDPKRYDYRELFPSSTAARVLSCNRRGFLLFPRLLLEGFRYDLINISTGPDSGHSSELLRLVFFYLCCLVHGRKIVLTLRNIYPYLESTPGLFALIRSKAIRYVSRFTFETHTMRQVFAECSRRNDILMGVSYDKYPDARVPSDDGSVAILPGAGKIIVGLLGTVNEARRDYGLVGEALSMLTPEQRARFMFVTLGACRGGLHHPAMQCLARHVEVDCRDGLLSERELVARGRACQLLMAPLNRDKAYGTLHGSGSFGDAVFLGKRLILPSFADKEGEFSDLCVYFSDAASLARILGDMPEQQDSTPCAGSLERFTTTSVYKSLVRDLDLCVLLPAGAQ